MICSCILATASYSSKKNMATSQTIRYVALDLETTGLDPRQHEIIEIGIVTPSL